MHACIRPIMEGYLYRRLMHRFAFTSTRSMLLNSRWLPCRQEQNCFSFPYQPSLRLIEFLITHSLTLNYPKCFHTFLLAWVLLRLLLLPLLLLRLHFLELLLFLPFILPFLLRYWLVFWLLDPRWAYLLFSAFLRILWNPISTVRRDLSAARGLPVS